MLDAEGFGDLLEPCLAFELLNLRGATAEPKASNQIVCTTSAFAHPVPFATSTRC